MKAKFVYVLIIGATLFLYACNKDSIVSFRHPTNGSGRLHTVLDTAITITPGSASIIGKWQQTKLRIQVKTNNNGLVADTSYSGAVFNANDYFEFKSDSTAYLQVDGIFSVSGIGHATDGAGNTIFGKGDYVYHIKGSALLLAWRLPVPQPLIIGADVRTIATLDAHNLVIHEVYTLDSSITVTDSYYTR
ncbi:hypothetical protein BH09BAC6_BH09BAC6_26150 [soil metagenome]|jgi:hypothetical protein